MPCTRRFTGSELPSLTTFPQDHCVLRCTWRGGAARKVVAGAAKDALPATHGPSLARRGEDKALTRLWQVESQGKKLTEPHHFS